MDASIGGMDARGFTKHGRSPVLTTTWRVRERERERGRESARERETARERQQGRERKKEKERNGMSV